MRPKPLAPICLRAGVDHSCWITIAARDMSVGARFKETAWSRTMAVSGCRCRLVEKIPDYSIQWRWERETWRVVEFPDTPER